MTIEVSDLYDALYEIVRIAWAKGEFIPVGGASGMNVGSRFADFCAELQHQFFFAACARRLGRATGHWIDLDSIGGHLRLHDMDGSLRAGCSGQQYHFHGFEWGTPDDRDVENRVVGGDLTPYSRAETRIFLHFFD